MIRSCCIVNCNWYLAELHARYGKAMKSFWPESAFGWFIGSKGFPNNGTLENESAMVGMLSLVPLVITRLVWRGKRCERPMRHKVSCSNEPKSAHHGRLSFLKPQKSAARGIVIKPKWNLTENSFSSNQKLSACCEECLTRIVNPFVVSKKNYTYINML